MRRLVLRQKENHHGPKIFEERIRQSGTRDEGAQRGDIEERPLGAEGHEPQAGDCDRSIRGEGCGGEGSEEDQPDDQEDGQEAEGEKVSDSTTVIARSKATGM